MRNNFRQHESRGLSSVWNPMPVDSLPSDAPTRPLSFGSFWGPGAGPAGPTTSAPSSSMHVRVDQLPTDREADMSLGPQASLVPQPRQDIPDSRVAARFYEQRRQFERTKPVETLLASRHNEPQLEISLSVEKRQLLEEVYTTLKVAGLKAPSSPLKPMLPADLYAAIRFFFRAISPNVPDDYTFTAQGSAYLLRLLGYNREQTEVDTFALRMPHRKSAWPFIVDILCWLHALIPYVSVDDAKFSEDLRGREGTGGRGGERGGERGERGGEREDAADGDAADGDAAGEDVHDSNASSPEACDSGDVFAEWLASDGVNRQMGFDEYLEFARISAFTFHSPTPDLAIEDTVPPEYMAEVGETLRKYTAETRETVNERAQQLENCNSQLFELERQMGENLAVLARCEELRNELARIEANVSAAADDVFKKRESMGNLQQEIDDLRVLLRQTQRDIEAVTEQLRENSIASFDEAVQMAKTQKNLTKSQLDLSDAVKSLKLRSQEQYERPAKQQLNALRILVDEYNEGINTSQQELLLNAAELPTQVQDVLRKPLGALLTHGLSTSAGDSPVHALQTLHRKWTRLEAAERSQLQDLEDEVSNMEAEIRSVETRLAHYNARIKDRGNAVSQLEQEKESLNENLVRKQNQHQRQQERVEQCRRLLSVAKTSLETLTKDNRRLAQEDQNMETKVHDALEKKRHFEKMLLDYQNSYSLLKDRVQQLERAAEGQNQAKLDAERRLAELKPVHNGMAVPTSSVPDEEYAVNRAHELLKR